MSDDLERELRERLHAAPLPGAPDRLRARLGMVVIGAPAPPRPRFVLLRPILATTAMIALIASVPLLGGRSGAPPAPVPVGSGAFGGASRAAATPAVWGPLAVANVDGVEHSRTEGTLELTDRCSFLVDDAGQRRILVWPAARTSWDAQTQSVRLRLVGASSPVSLSSGDAVEVGGGGSSRAEDGLSSEAWADRYDWAASPAPECLTEERWVVAIAAPRETGTASAGPTR